MTALVVDGPKGPPPLATSVSPTQGAAADPLPEDMLEGYLDFNDGKRLFGWAWCRSRPSVPVEVEIRVDDRPVMTLTADRPRQDLIRGGLGDGRHGFNAKLADPLPADEKHRITAFVRAAPGGPAKALIISTPKPKPPKSDVEPAGGAGAETVAPAVAGGPEAAARSGRLKQAIGTLLGGQRSMQTAITGLGTRIEQLSADRRGVDGAAIVTLTRTVEQLQSVQETLARQAAAVEILQTRLDAAAAALNQRDAPPSPRRDDRGLYWMVGALSLISVASLLIGLYSLLA